MTNGYHSQRLASEEERNQFLMSMPLDTGVVKKEWVLLAGYHRSYNASQRIKYLLEHKYVISSETGKKYGNVKELQYHITDEGIKFRALLEARADKEIPEPPKSTTPNFDLFNENKESPIAILMQEIAVMEEDLEAIKSIASKYMDETE